MSAAHEGLMAGAIEVPFAEIDATLARMSGATRERQAAARALTATVVVVGPRERLDAAADALAQLGDSGGVRAMLISTGTEIAPPARVARHAVALDGLRAEFVDNAVAALRLSSLPTLVWWRGGAAESLDGLARLAERIVLDAEEPEPVWARALTLLDHTAFTDLRWTRLTRWRALMAQFFDVPEVREAAARFHQLHVHGSDAPSARLFAAWLTGSLGRNIALTVTAASHPVDSVAFGDGRQRLLLRLVPSGTCVETTAEIDGHSMAARKVAAGDQRLAALVGQELRIRAHDAAFEQALRGAGVP